MTKKDMEAGECSKCGGNRFNKEYKCLDCRNEHERLKRIEKSNNEKLKPTDKMCDICGENNWSVYGKCKNCRNMRSKINLERGDRICSGGCGNLANKGLYYCIDCHRIQSQSYFSRDDRKCPDCDNMCVVGQAYCKDCKTMRVRKRRLIPDRICPTENCYEYCQIGQDYCIDCSSVNRQNRRAMVVQAEGSHTGLEQRSIFKLFGDICLECLITDSHTHEKLHADHSQSLHNGGSNGLYNIQPLCAYHNLSKGAKNVRYIEEALDILEIPVDDYLNVVGLSDDDYSYILDWWDDLGEKEYKEFDW